MALVEILPEWGSTCGIWKFFSSSHCLPCQFFATLEKRLCKISSPEWLFLSKSRESYFMALYDLAVKRVKVLRFLFGMKPVFL